MRCTVPVPIPSDLATFKIPMPFASCFRTFSSVALSIFDRPSLPPWATATSASCEQYASLQGRLTARQRLIGSTPMPQYIMLVNFTEQGLKGVKEVARDSKAIRSGTQNCLDDIRPL